ncbi:MAG: NAD-dependent epimerase/dehydratase family protein [Opitutales bacterium]
MIVTGAAGFIGSHTVDRLLEKECQVLGIDNLRTGTEANLEQAFSSPAFQLEIADVMDGRKLDDLIRSYRPEAIIHLAALVSVQESLENPDLNFSLNLNATHVIAESARKASVPRVVFASSAAVYGDDPPTPTRETETTRPISPYGTAKRASEVLLHGYGRSFGISSTCFRYFNVYGPRQDPGSPYSGVISIFQDRFSRNEPVTVFGDGLQTRDFISVFDVARANVFAATNPKAFSGTVNICTGQPSSLRDILGIFQNNFPGALPPRFAAPRSGDIRDSLGAPERAEEVLGFRARINLTEGLTALIKETF